MIVVDQNIPYGSEAFSSAGEILRLPGRDIRREHLRSASALVVRSITKVDRSLLEGTPVRFVGTCTIGTDHLDIPWLESQGIAWTSAPGCNARSVAEYVAAALALGHRAGRIDLGERPMAGVVGAGRVGRQVEAVLRALDLPVLRNDPPRARSEGMDGFSDLDELLGSCRIVCAHLPLTRTGPDATEGLLTWEHLRRLPQGALFLNAGRGATAPSAELSRLARERPDLSLVLDVWDPEPRFPSELAAACLAGTPHIAGYSFEGKVEGTRIVQERLAAVRGLPCWTVPDLPSEPLDWAPPPGRRERPHDVLADLILEAYDLPGDASRFAALHDLRDEERSRGFDGLRRDYPVRREFRNRPVSAWERIPESIREIAMRLGFTPR